MSLCLNLWAKPVLSNQNCKILMKSMPLIPKITLNAFERNIIALYSVFSRESKPIDGNTLRFILYQKLHIQWFPSNSWIDRAPTHIVYISLKFGISSFIPLIGGKRQFYHTRHNVLITLHTTQYNKNVRCRHIEKIKSERKKRSNKVLFFAASRNKKLKNLVSVTHVKLISTEQQTRGKKVICNNSPLIQEQSSVPIRHARSWVDKTSQSTQTLTFLCTLCNCAQHIRCVHVVESSLNSTNTL